MKTQCRCHGVSGSCELKTCWRTLPPFSEVGDFLKKKYELAIRVKAARKRLRRQDKSGRKMPVMKDDLVHIHKSPNYCVENQTKGILGTRGRVCNKTTTGPESCDLLCCGRGYNTQVVKHVERCHCKFIWCCYVRCKACETMMDIHTCKWTRYFAGEFQVSKRNLSLVCFSSLTKVESLGQNSALGSYYLANQKRLRLLNAHFYYQPPKRKEDEETIW